MIQSSSLSSSSSLTTNHLFQLTVIKYLIIIIILIELIHIHASQIEIVARHTHQPHHIRVIAGSGPVDKSELDY